MIDKLINQTYTASCFLCGSNKVKKTKERRPVDFNIVRFYYKCQICQGYSLWPKLEKWEIERLYSANYIVDVNPDSQPDHESNMARFTYVKNFLASIQNPNDKSFLDYGCGASAEVVILAKNLFFQSFGVEVALETRVLAGKKSGCTIYSPQEIAEGQHQFDVVFLGDLLEHVSNPLEILASTKKCLRDGGYLIIQGPLEGSNTLSNFLVSIKARLLAGRPSTFPAYHVLLATRDSMLKMLKINNFHITTKQITEPLWPATRLGSKESLTSPSRFLLSFAKFLDMTIHKINKSYGTRIFIVAQK